jgi:hypothetical protein
MTIAMEKMVLKMPGIGLQIELHKCIIAVVLIFLLVLLLVIFLF